MVKSDKALENIKTRKNSGWLEAGKDCDVFPCARPLPGFAGAWPVRSLVPVAVAAKAAFFSDGKVAQFRGFEVAQLDAIFYGVEAPSTCRTTQSPETVARPPLDSGRSDRPPPLLVPVVRLLLAWHCVFWGDWRVPLFSNIRLQRELQLTPTIFCPLTHKRIVATPRTFAACP